jgi:hypothetical protein
MRAGRAVIITTISYAIEPDKLVIAVAEVLLGDPENRHVLSKKLVLQASGFSDHPFQSKLKVR